MTEVVLGDVARFVRGVTFKPTDIVADGGTGTVGVMRTKNVQTVLDQTDVLRIPSALVKRQDQLLLAGDILISSANSWHLVGKCCWVPELEEPAAVGGFVTALRPASAAVDARYLYHWFSSPRTQALVRSFGNQTTNIANLNLRRCEQLRLPLPSLDEQRRIAAILDQADAVRAAGRLALKYLDVLGRSMFLDMFGQPMKASSLWPRVALGQLARIIRGASPRPAGDPQYFGGDIPWLKISDITAATGRVVTSIKDGVTEAGCAKSVLLPPNTLVLTNSATVGIPKIIRPATCIHDGFLAFLDLERGVNQTWLYAALHVSRERLVALAPEGTQKNLNAPIVKGVELALPPIELQKAFASRLAGAEAACDFSVTRAESLDMLLHSLQARSFGGDL